MSDGTSKHADREGPADQPAPGVPSVPPSNAAFLLMTLGQRIRDRVDRDLRAHRISLRHLSALGHLHRRPGISYSELARRAHVTPQSMMATLRNLEERDAVKRSSDPGRGRTATLHLTAEGHRLREQGQSILAQAEAELLAEVPPELHQCFIDALGNALRASFEPS
ncbi:MarR family winged helix-turn-helix transcriptional regulator [Amycolatopsis mediterranei]|nr:MarR family transcriptional regulator [Amycolatopsis mediterranei]UZF73252.1 MarR family transcriptional regulator [Amycolatopsis mediterranei]